MTSDEQLRAELNGAKQAEAACRRERDEARAAVRLANEQLLDAVERGGKWRAERDEALSDRDAYVQTLKDVAAERDAAVLQTNRTAEKWEAERDRFAADAARLLEEASTFRRALAVIKGLGHTVRLGEREEGCRSTGLHGIYCAAGIAEEALAAHPVAATSDEWLKAKLDEARREGYESCRAYIESAACEETLAARDAKVAEKAWLRALGEAAAVCDAFMHRVPADGGDELDLVGRYSNGTVMRIMSSIRELATTPPTATGGRHE